MEKKIIVMLIAVLCFSVPSFGLGFMGPPKAGLEQGQFGAGINYSYSKMDLEFANVATGEVQTNILAVDIGYGIMNQWEGFARLGFAKVEQDDIGFDGGNKFTYGFGTKVTFIEQEPISWGGLLQINWFEGDDTISGFDVDFDAYEMQIAIGPTYEADSMRIYGGPFLHLVDGDLSASGVLPGWGAVSGSVDIEQESVFGGYIGAQFDLAENTTASVEVQFTGDAWAITGGIGWGF